MATGKIIVETSEFPGKGEVFIYVATDKDLKKSECFQELDSKIGKKLSSKLALHDFKGKENQIVTLELNDFYKYIIIVGAGTQKEFTLIKWRNALANVFKTIQSMKCTQVSIDYYEELGMDYFEIGKQMAVAFYLSNYSFDIFRGEDERKKITKLEQLSFHVREGQKIDRKNLDAGISYGKLLADGVYLARNLVNQPASHVHPETLVQEAFMIEKESKGLIQVEVLDKDECKRLGMGAYLGVAQGSEREPKFIVLHYKGMGKKKICLIGKSITFDSGGLSLKPSGSMETMKMDMAGGAAVLGVFKVLANTEKNEFPEIYGLLPACENMPSGKALKPGDVVTALNKKTIEVLNTDAEGRLALADALSYAEEYIKPDVMIDLATLTGACMVALGNDISGLFGNNEKLIKVFEQIAKQEGEELWSLPLYKPYAKSIKSDIADFKNSGGSRYGGAITAALFLSEFVKKTDWIHIDIAGPAFNEGSVHDIIPKGGTGWGVLTLVSFLALK